MKTITNMADFLQKDEVRSESPEKVQAVASGIIKAAGSLIGSATFNTSAPASKDKVKVSRFFSS